MIVHRADSGGRNRTLGPGGSASWVCLARRGMLHSETEAVDHLRLEPGTRLDGRGRDGLGEAWFVLTGTGELDDGRRVAAHDLIVRRPGAADGLRAETALELLTISVLPDSTAERLPVRTPEMAADGGREEGTPR